MGMLMGILVTSLGGLIMGISPTPLKFMRKFKYEQFGFISMPVALFILPWSITLIFCPNISAAFGEMDKILLLKGNLFTLCWGIAQVLAMLCFLRIGVSLTYGILCAIGASVGVITPMIFKASGIFGEAPDVISKAGLTVLCGVAVMVLGVFFASLAGLGREKSKQNSEEKSQTKTGKFYVGLIMVIAAGVLSAGWGFAFFYSYEHIVGLMQTHGAAAFPSRIAVWAFVFTGAVLVNMLYPAYLLTKNKSWKVLANNGRDIILSILYGVLFFIPSVLLGEGSLMLGALGASVGWGIIQGTIIVGGQLLGFATGEWRGVTGKPQMHIYLAIVILIISMAIMALGKSFA